MQDLGTSEAATQQLHDHVSRNVFAESNAPGLAETILYVEDEAFVREATYAILCSAGYRVFIAKTSAEAARIYQEQYFEIDLLLTDVVLPGESGQALAARLRQRDPRLKVLLVSGYGNQILRREGMHGGYLAKPFSSATLLQRVRMVLDETESASSLVHGGPHGVTGEMQDLRSNL
jgi:DNA-binding response OmpR family regulator